MGLRYATIKSLAMLSPADEVDPSDELTYSLSFIESAADAETVVEASYGALIVSFLLPVPLLALPVAIPLPVVLGFGVLLGGVTFYTIQEAPHLLAAFRRTRALGDTPNLIGRAVLRMEIQPSLETAVQFAADTGRGPLADSLAANVNRSMGTPQTGLLSFADEWSDHFPALRRSAHLLATAESAPEGERARTLDRSLEAILHGTKEHMAEFTNEIQGPSTAIFAFGVLLPMALVALTPAAGFADIPTPIWAFVAIYDVALPCLLVGASVWLLVRRPVAFPPPDVTRAHPDIPDRIWPPFAAAIAGVVGGLLIPKLAGVGYLAPIAAVGLGIGLFLRVYFQPVKDVRTHVRDVEAHLTDALYLIGRQISEGEAVEAAIHHAADRVPAETGEVFEHASGLQQRLHLSVDEAFFGDHGALKDVPSARAHGTASLLSIAADEGQPAGRAIVSMADHLEELQEVENEAKRDLSSVTGTLETTAGYFGPLIAGVVIALADAIGQSDAIAEFAGGTVPTDQLALVVGAYVLTMSIILTTLSVGLRYGLDRSLVGHNVGNALIVSIPLYVGSVWGIGQIITPM